MKGSPVAYDYATQEWVSGAAATKVLAAQYTDELALLESPQGAAYLTMMTPKGQVVPSLTEAIASVRRLIAAL